MKGLDYTKLDEEIYMICFSKPRYPGEIRDLLLKSGRTTQQSQLLLNNPKSRLTKLIEKGWIKELTKDEKLKILDEIDDKRAKRRQYVQSTLNPLIEYFKCQIDLVKNEERQLKHLIERKSFRPIFSWEVGFRSFDTVREFLFQLTFWTNIAVKYTAPYRMDKKIVDKIGKKKLFSEMTGQLMEKRNMIAQRISPKLKIDWTPSKRERFYTFIEDANDKLKPPLFDKLMKLSNNQRMFYEMSLCFLACGEFMNEFQQKQKKK